MKIDLYEWLDKTYSDNDRSTPKNEYQGGAENGLFPRVIN